MSAPMTPSEEATAALNDAADRIERRAQQLNAVWLRADQVVGALRRIAGDGAAAEPTFRPRQLTPMQVLARDVETAIAPLTGDAKAGAEMVLRYIRTLAAEATVPTVEATS